MLARKAAPAQLRSILGLISSSGYQAQSAVFGKLDNEDAVAACDEGFRTGVGHYARIRQSKISSCHGERLIRACSTTQPPTVRCAGCFQVSESSCSSCRKQFPITDNELPQGAPSTLSDAIPKLSSHAMPSNASDAPVGDSNLPRTKSCDVIQPTPPIAIPADLPRQIEAGIPSQAARNLSHSPQALVEYLDHYIVGQANAKRAVAVALRQRWRRRQVPDPEIRADITPKNILLIGPTGVGKTEIARRLAKHLDAPFLKVEATKYTEVGFHGRDVDQIIKDLMEVAVKQKKAILETQLRSVAEEKAETKVLEALAGKMPAEEYAMWLRHLRRGSLDTRRIQIDMPMQTSAGPQGGLSDLETAMREIKDSRIPSLFASDFRMMERRYVTIKEALTRLTQAELDNMITKEMIVQQAVEAVEQEGIVFVDEIDKICSKSGSGGFHGPDASDEGVQRDLLPLLEGSIVATRYGEIRTDYILFIASGAFHSVRPSDMLAELQGRLPVRVTLNPLSEEDFRQILTKTRHNLIEQHKALLATEGVILEFTDDAIAEIARVAWQVNSQIENIGARRLHTVIEKVLEEVNLNATRLSPGTTVVIDKKHVMDSVSALHGKMDHSRFIL